MSAQAADVSSAQRGLFEIPDAITYLNCANLSPQLRAVTDIGIAAVRRKSSPWTVRAEDWFAPAEQLRALFAEIVHADTDGIALVPSVSYGIAIAASNLPVARGQAIVLLADEFPSNVYAWRKLAEKREAVVRTVTRGSTGAWTDSVVQAITSDTAIVSVPNCHWTDGRFVDLVKIGEATRRVGAALVLSRAGSSAAGRSTCRRAPFRRLSSDWQVCLRVRRP
jgi:selenocysteine lyase/cysteine desulfurase